MALQRKPLTRLTRPPHRRDETDPRRHPQNSLLTPMRSIVKGARSSSFGRHRNESKISGGVIPVATRFLCRPSLGKRVFLFRGAPVTYSRKDGHRAQNPSHGRFTKGPRLMTSEARLISVNDPVASTGKSALRRSPRSYGWIPAITGMFVRWSAPSLDASSARHGLVRKDELCPERRVSPSWMTQQQAPTDRLTEEMRLCDSL